MPHLFISRRYVNNMRYRPVFCVYFTVLYRYQQGVYVLLPGKYEGVVYVAAEPREGVQRYG